MQVFIRREKHTHTFRHVNDMLSKMKAKDLRKTIVLFSQSLLTSLCFLECLFKVNVGFARIFVFM